jgi:hypothetical protein
VSGVEKCHMAIHVLVVHGVGRYDRASTERKIRKLLARTDPAGASHASISSFDWSNLVNPLAEISPLGKASLVEDQYSGSCGISFLSGERPPRNVHFQKSFSIPMTVPQNTQPLGCGYDGCKGKCKVDVRYDKANPSHFLALDYCGEGLCSRLPGETDGSPGDEIPSLLGCAILFAAVSIPIWNRTGRFWLASLFGIDFDREEILGRSVSSFLD